MGKTLRQSRTYYELYTKDENGRSWVPYGGDTGKFKSPEDALQVIRDSRQGLSHCSMVPLKIVRVTVLVTHVKDITHKMAHS